MFTATLPEAFASPPLTVPALSERAQGAYEVFRDVALQVSRARGYSRAVTQVFFFCPGEVVADTLCMARSTLYRKLAELKAAELVEGRAHYVTHEGRTKADGMVWAVKLDASRPGRISVPHDALKCSYRCLSADIESGRTAFRQVGQSKNNPTKQVRIEKILSWAIPPQQTQNPVKGMTVRADLEQILDVPYADKEDRNTAVDGAARAISQGLGDPDGLMFYRWLLWQLLRASDRLQGDYWHQVYEHARRARAEAAEGFARKPGALFVMRLKGMLWWDGVARMPPHRVGVRPPGGRA